MKVSIQIEKFNRQKTFGNSKDSMTYVTVELGKG